MDLAGPLGTPLGLNLFHAMEGISHLHLLVVKEYEMPMCDWSSDVCSSDLEWFHKQETRTWGLWLPQHRPWLLVGT